jgi:hypothetical protein
LYLTANINTGIQMDKEHFALIHMDKGNARDIVNTAEGEREKKVDRSDEK